MRQVVAIVWVLLVAGGCGRSAPPAMFSSTFDTKEAAAQAVLDALWSRNPDRLRDLPITETEFRKHIWPALPVAKADIGATPDYAWAEMSQKNAGYLGALLAEYGGRRLILRHVSFRGQVTGYDTFTTHGKTELTVDVDGRQEAVRLFGSMIESGGRWKIYSYVVD
jgi:hypothetical protein